MHNLISFIKQRFFYKIRYQAVLLLFLTMLLPILSIQMVNIYTTYDYTLKKNQAILNENLLLSSELLNSKLAAYRDIFFSISTDTVFMDNMISLNQTTEDTMIYRRIRDSLDTSITSNILLCPEIQAVGVIGTNHVPYIYAQKRQQFESVVNYFNDHYKELEVEASDSYKLKAGVIMQESTNNPTSSPSFYISASCLHYEKMTNMGTLILFINPQEINNMVNNPNSEVYDYTSRILLTNDQKIICDKHENNGFYWNQITKYSYIDTSSIMEKSELIQGKNLISSMNTDYFNLTLVNITDYNKMNHSLIIFWIAILSLTIVVLVLILYGTFHLIGREFISPIERIATAMKSVNRTHLDNKIKTIRKNEIGDIEYSYNKMLTEIKSLLEENQKQTEYLLEMNNRACTAELKSLELQINPHFIFNTLDTINWTAMQEGSSLVSEQLNYLASILRYTVYNINQIVPFFQDIAWIEQYLKFQKMRFHNSFTYDIFVEKGISNLKIHKLLLQPFLENSLIHGFDGITWEGHIYVECKMLRSTYLEICLTDNGIGISSEILEKIRRLFSPSQDLSQDFSDSIGLSNIVYRTRKYYPGSRLTVSSRRYCTCFKLFIPICEME